MSQPETPSTPMSSLMYGDAPHYVARPQTMSESDFDNGTQIAGDLNEGKFLYEFSHKKAVDECTADSDTIKHCDSFVDFEFRLGQSSNT